MEKSSKNKIYRAIGLMSGTAMDGIDAALIETDGYNYIKHIGAVYEPHDPKFKSKLKSCLNRSDRKSHDILAIEKQFTLAQIPVINKLINKLSLNKQDIDLIGFHGQTIHHNPDAGETIQLGDGKLLAKETGTDVVYDFRTNDMKNKGQGAPLIPVYHRALIQNSELNLPIVILNLGGVSNITWMLDHELIGFDPGPANALIDDWIKKHTNKPYDEDGKIASQGCVDNAIIDTFMTLNYFNKPYPKSLDRNEFANISVDHLSLEDGATTLTEMTCLSIKNGIDICPSPPTAIYATGGGRLNKYMMKRLKEITSISVHNVDELSWDGDALEAEGFAYMAVRKILNEPISYPSTTGCKTPTVGGALAKS